MSGQRIFKSRSRSRGADRQAQAHILRAKCEWESTVDALSQLVCLLDGQGRVIRANRIVETWGLGQVDAVREVDIHNLCHPGCTQNGCHWLDEWPRVWDGLRRGISGEYEVHDTVWSRDVRIQAHLITSPGLPVGGEAGFAVLVVEDVSERKRSQDIQRALRESEDRFRIMADTAPVMIWMSEPDTQCSFFNQPWLNFTGRTWEQEKGNGWAEGVYPDDFDRCLETYLSAFAARRPFQMEYRLRRFDGVYRWILDTGVPRWSADGVFAGYIGSCIDITGRKEAEERLQNAQESLAQYADQLHTLASRLAELEEANRQRLSRELHDRIGQNLTALGINLNIIRSLVDGQHVEAARRYLADSLDLVGQTAGLVRDVMADLRPPVLDDYGLMAALHWYAEQFSARTGLLVHLEGGTERLDLLPGVEIALFRIVQEALTNVVRHARAGQVVVRVQAEVTMLRLMVTDDGVGFDVTAQRSSSWGLLIMAERARAVGAVCRVESRPGQGTQVIVELPR